MCAADPLSTKMAHWVLVPGAMSTSGEGAITSADQMVNSGLGYYLEAQITGGVKLDDVDKIIFENPDYATSNPTLYDGNVRPDKAEMDVYNAHGIKVVDEKGLDWNDILKQRASY